MNTFNKAINNIQEDNKRLEKALNSWDKILYHIKESRKSLERILNKE